MLNNKIKLSLFLTAFNIFTTLPIEIKKSEKLVKQSKLLGVIYKNTIFCPRRVCADGVCYINNVFYVLKNKKSYKVNCYNLDSNLRKMDKSDVCQFLKHGYFYIDQNMRGEYTLSARPRLSGGGPITCGVFYWGTKAVSYGIGLAAASTIVVASGGTAGAATGAIAAAGSLGASAGTSVVAGAIVGAGYGSAAATATVAVVGSSGSLATVAAAIEGASITMGAIGAWLPLP